MPLKGKKTVIRIMRKRADKLIRALTLEMWSRIVKRTPVDTGRARANWRIGIDVPDVTVDGSAGGKSIKKTPTVATKSRKGFGTAYKNVSGTIKKAGAGKQIYITNGLHYVRYLEYGKGDGKPSSRQAPKGMVRVTVAELQPLIRQILKKIILET